GLVRSDRQGPDRRPEYRLGAQTNIGGERWRLRSAMGDRRSAASKPPLDRGRIEGQSLPTSSLCITLYFLPVCRGWSPRLENGARPLAEILCAANVHRLVYREISGPRSTVRSSLRHHGCVKIVQHKIS